MSTNKDGFEKGSSIESDDLLTYQAKQRQKLKGEPVKPSKDAELLSLLANELASQKVRLKPLGIEQLASAVKSHFAPAKKKAAPKKAI